MKFYRKQPIEAEQFDGSNEMVDKYELIDAGTMLGTHHSPELYLTGSGKVDVGDWIITDNFNHHTLMTDEEFKQQYAGLPVIPKNVANYLTDCKLANTTIETSLSGNIMLFSRARSHDMIHDILSWLCPSDNQDLFARAWLDGYQVEEDR
ncbi:DUF1642 domain-containing protein [Lactiplantibacillus plantarum]|uniref:DUF1642 domain-containing protein n=1 Tax=Lactiplantibacillus plantarum TaxID=1590 RepID=UPI000C80D154|nr:DUF1642 domain-containing protein [Lactiplantibacillus plantarum]MBO2704013.1 DUF1642 domain-containing protein [Lactiplantibacillus plantarum]PME02957.1 hypothetical protein S101520_00099 [Lactiplantibacillus plantarum subsp. plantarum]WRM17375.1 DUF1642 domain-containing protein [Lactiplantibacillus plantarum]